MNPTGSLASTISTDWVKFQSETDTKDTKSNRTSKRLIPALKAGMDLWVDYPVSVRARKAQITSGLVDDLLPCEQAL